PLHFYTLVVLVRGGKGDIPPPFRRRRQAIFTFLVPWAVIADEAIFTFLVPWAVIADKAIFTFLFPLAVISDEAIFAFLVAFAFFLFVVLGGVAVAFFPLPSLRIGDLCVSCSFRRHRR